MENLELEDNEFFKKLDIYDNNLYQQLAIKRQSQMKYNLFNDLSDKLDSETFDEFLINVLYDELKEY